VSFTKGCYLGQEVVARMKSLGHPKKVLVGLKIKGRGMPSLGFEGGEAQDGLPVAGAEVLEGGEAGGKRKVIGGVTSSAASPLRGQEPIGFAVVRWGRHRPGTAVAVAVGRETVEAEVCGLEGVVGG
jgi:folate-binding Fe-S cluster repair protein YgfZ